MWGEADLAVCNGGNSTDGGWLGLHRCDNVSAAFRRGHGKQRTHGIVIGDVDGDSARL